MKTEFLLYQSGDPQEDFFSNITELFLDLENSFESPEDLAMSVQEMYGYTLEIATETQKKRFYEIALFFKHVVQYIRNNEEPFYDFKYNLRSYIDGRFMFNEETGEALYFDHPMHQRYFNQANIKKEWYTTETK